MKACPARRRAGQFRRRSLTGEDDDHGRDPNLGRVLMAVGRSGARVDVAKTSVWIGDHQAFAKGAPTELAYAEIARSMDRPEITLRVDLGLGEHTATAWGCDLTAEYVRAAAAEAREVGPTRTDASRAERSHRTLGCSHLWW